MTDIWRKLHGTQWSVSQVPFHTKHCAISHATLCYLACNTVRSCTQTLCFLSYVMHSAFSHAVLCILSCLEHSAILHASLCGLIRNTLQSDLRRALQLHRPKHQSSPQCNLAESVRITQRPHSICSCWPLNRRPDWLTQLAVVREQEMSSKGSSVG